MNSDFHPILHNFLQKSALLHRNFDMSILKMSIGLKTIPGGRSATATTCGEAGTPTPGGERYLMVPLGMAGAISARHLFRSDDEGKNSNERNSRFKSVD